MFIYYMPLSAHISHSLFQALLNIKDIFVRLPKTVAKQLYWLRVDVGHRIDQALHVLEAISSIKLKMHDTTLVLTRMILDNKSKELTASLFNK